VVEGEGDVTVGGDTTRVRAGDLVLAKAEEPHAMANPGPGRLVVLVAMAPPPAKKT
jgi:mannose-6-phosphate isomerase-like protein (cupin superfamily)